MTSPTGSVTRPLGSGRMNLRANLEYLGKEASENIDSPESPH